RLDPRQPPYVRRGELRARHGDHLRGGRESACRRHPVRACGDLARPHSAAARVAGGVPAQHHVRASRRGRASCDDAAARELLLMKLLLVGHGKMGRMVESLAPEYGCEIAGVLDPGSPVHGGGPDAAAWNGVDVAVDFSTPDSVPVNAPALARRGINLVVGTTGWSTHEAAIRRAVADSGAGMVVAPNFSIGVVLFEALVARAAQLFAA